VRRLYKIFLALAITLGSVLLLAAIFVFLVVPSAWFQNYVRQKIVSSAEQATGGVVELQRFRFDIQNLSATATGFVLHGTEPAGSPPLFQAPSIVLRLKLFAARAIDLEYLGVERPSVNLLISPDGRTNIPTPKKKSSGSTVDTVVDLAIAKVDIHNGAIHLSDRTVPLNVQGDNLRIELAFDPSLARYQGLVSMAPIYLVSDGRPPVAAQLSIPLVLAKNSVRISNARVSTAQSGVAVNAELWNLAAPDASVRVSAHVGLEEMSRVVEYPLHFRGAPRTLEASAMLRMSGTAIQVQNASLVLGKSRAAASGSAFRASIDLDEISNLLALAEHPSGTVDIAGNAVLPSQASGTIRSGPISISFGGSRFQNIQISSNFRADSHAIEVSNVDLHALGGVVGGNASLAGGAVHAALDLRGFDIQNLTREVAKEQIRYAGTVDGKVEGGAKLKGNWRNTILARADLTIVPKTSGTPVSGTLDLDYRGGLLALDHSRLRLPHSAIALGGVLGERAVLNVTSRDLSDFFSVPVALHNGSAQITVYEQGPLENPQISGSVSASNFSAGSSTISRLSASFIASPSRVSIQNGTLGGPGVEARFTGFIGLDHWKPSSQSPISANGEIHNGKLGDILAFAGESRLKATGTVNASLNVSGIVARPLGGAQLSITDGSVLDTPFERIESTVAFNQQETILRKLQVVAPAGSLEAQGTYSQGRIRATLSTTDVSLTRLGIEGTARVTGDVAASLQNGNFALNALNFNLSAHTQRYGGLTAIAATRGNQVYTRVDSDVAGSLLRATARTELVADYPTSANASVAHLELAKVIPAIATGSLSGSATFSGTIGKPNLSANVELVHATVYQQPISSAEASVAYSKQSLKLNSLKAEGPAGTVEMHGLYSHAPSDLRQGRGEVWISTKAIDLARVVVLQKREPGLSGVLAINGAVALDVGQHILPVRANFTGGLTKVALNGAALGNLSFTSQTSGSAVAIALDSDLAKSSVHGKMRISLAGNYPAEGSITFEHVTLAGLRPFVPNLPPEVDAELDGEASGTVPLENPREAQGEARLTRVEVTAQKLMRLQNPGPVVVRVDHSTLRVESARITGPSTDISIAGSAALNRNGALDATVNAKTDMNMVKIIHPNAFTAGSLNASATIRGTFSHPSMNGEIRVQNVSLQLSTWANGISNVNGVIQLNGNSARIVSFTADSGGGKITATGFAGYTGTALDINLRADARDVRVRYAGASVSANAAVTLTGTSRRSVLGGTVTITRVGYSQQSDIGSILTAKATPPELPASATGILGLMRLNVRIQTAPDVVFQTSLAQQLSATADLTLAGTAASPGMVGRVNITGGTLIFFGNKYTVNRGSIAFYNANSIDPMLDVDLETSAQGVEVDIGVSGPIEDLKLSYHSDPPLKFQDIISLLAAGKTPPDPTIAVNQPYAPTQSSMQMGESAVLGAAVANPVSSRLARVFGVTQLSIAPSFVSGSVLPQTRITVQQQVNTAVTVTYSEDLSQANAELVRVEWTLTPRFSAIATRDENGIFGVDFYYKRQFK